MNPRVVHINISDRGGGAENIAWMLMNECEAEGSMVVQVKKSDSDNVFALGQSWIDFIANKTNAIMQRLGLQIGIKQWLGLTEKHNQTITKLSQIEAYQKADIVHLHNIHGGYFDLAALEWIARHKKIVWTLHDMWAFTGGEAHTFGDCSFEKGEVPMPQSDIYPIGKSLRDNRKRWMLFKRMLYKSIKDQIYFIPVCDWLADGLQQSYVWPVEGNLQVIYNGVDTNIFSNEDRRHWLKPRVLLFNSDNPYKGSAEAVEILQTLGDRIDIVSVGNSTSLLSEIINHSRISTPDEMNALLNKVDILLFPSKAESFPLQVLEAMASGVCVVSADVGGVGEALKKEIGALYKSTDSSDAKIKLEQRVNSLAQSREMGRRAAIKVFQSFDKTKMVTNYNQLYHTLTLEVNS